MTERNKFLKKSKLVSKIGVAMIFAGFALMSTEYDVIVPIGAVLFFLGLAVFTVGRMSVSQVKKCFCKDCGKKFDYEEDVVWEVISEETHSSSNRASITTTVRITCTCSHCGYEKTFTKRICTASVDSLGKTTCYNLEDILRSYFKVSNKSSRPAVTKKAETNAVKSNKEQLQELKELLNDGLITQEDFDAKKEQILDL